MRVVEAMRVEVGPQGTVLWLIDQRLLPHEERWVRCDDAQSTATAIRDMVVRGAPAIAITAAWGLAIHVSRGFDRAEGHRVLLESRPTAVNLRWALERLAPVPDGELLAEARRIHDEDVQINHAMGRHGADLLPDHAVILTICNTGSLATGGWGTALGIVREAHARGRLSRVYACETRPYLQGARLTAWECQREQIPCTLITDNMAAALLASTRVDAILAGCDRVAKNGDTANKIGTLMLGVLARHYNVPLYIAMPRSTLDLRCPSGAQIPIEQRPPAEVRGHRDLVWAADVDVWNPSFDVTPAGLISGWVSERGVEQAPFAG